MSRSQVDWNAHVAAYKSSGQSLADYCRTAEVKITTLRHHVYKAKKPEGRRPRRKSHFQEIPLASELVITRAPSGELSLRGFDAADLSALIKAWSDAVPS